MKIAINLQRVFGRGKKFEEVRNCILEELIGAVGK